MHFSTLGPLYGLRDDGPPGEVKAIPRSFWGPEKPLPRMPSVLPMEAKRQQWHTRSRVRYVQPPRTPDIPRDDAGHLEAARLKRLRKGR